MVEVTGEMRECSLQLWDMRSHERFRHTYGNLVANTIEDISGIHGEY